MKSFDKELVSKMEKQVVSSIGVVSTDSEIMEAMKKSVDKYNMAHGSHKQHSSSGEYGKRED